MFDGYDFVVFIVVDFRPVKFARRGRCSIYSSVVQALPFAGGRPVDSMYSSVRCSPARLASVLVVCVCCLGGCVYTVCVCVCVLQK